MIAIWILFFLGLAGLYWVYDGYGRFLQLMAAVAAVIGRLKSQQPVTHEGPLPSIAVLITAHNEAHNIAKRLDNLLQCEYPADRLSIVVAADGCTDATCDIVRDYIHQINIGDAASRGPEIRLFESPGLGKTATQNGAIAGIHQDIIVFTDADVIFDLQFLISTGRQYLDPGIGAVAGHLLFAPPGEDAVVSGQGFFWNYELKLRRLETDLNLLAVVAGSCFSMRRQLFVPMDSSIGEDCIVPLDVVSQGYRVVQDQNAICYDQFEYGSDVVMRKRIRMTLRNWQGTWTRPALLNPLQHPRYAFALWSHKILRWLSPVFLLLATVAAVVIALTSSSVWGLLAIVPFAALYLAAAIGWATAGKSLRIPGTAAAFSFLLVNTAFLIGVCKSFTGQRIHSYRNFIALTDSPASR